VVCVAEQFLIWSNHHKLWWGPDGRGYTRFVDRAGRYELAATEQWLTRGCGCCLVPEVPVPVPAAELVGDPDGLRRYVRYKPVVATLRAKRAGRVNRWAETGGRR
jgi:hypothetical protein